MESKKNVLLLALSTLRFIPKKEEREMINPETNLLEQVTVETKEKTIVKSKLYDVDKGKTLIGEYHYSLESTILYLYRKKIKIDTVIMISTHATKKEFEFSIDGKERKESAESYLEKYIKAMLGKQTEIISIPKDDISEWNEIDIIKQVITTIRQINEEGMNLYIDIHGGLRATQIMLQSIINLLRYEGIEPCEIYSTNYNEGDKTTHVDLVKDTYDIQSYVAGMSEFLSYGRTQSLEKYYDKNKAADDRLFTHIRNISDAIQLCHVRNFDEAIKDMRDFIEDPSNFIEDPSKKNDYNDLFIEPIKASYGELMDSRGRNMVINKVKWCVRNDFLQQALTIIESQMPKELMQRNVIAYHYDENRTEKKIKLYKEVSKNHLREILGGIKLSDALNYRKPNWETEINFSIIPWMRENCREMPILGNDKTTYISYMVDNVTLSKNCIIKDVNSNGNVIQLKFDISKKLSTDGEKNLARLLMLHLALKECRNASNHADSKNRASVDEVKTAIYAYIDLAEKVITEVASKRENSDINKKQNQNTIFRGTDEFQSSTFGTKIGEILPDLRILN